MWAFCATENRGVQSLLVILYESFAWSRRALPLLHSLSHVIYSRLTHLSPALRNTAMWRSSIAGSLMGTLSL